MRWRGKRETLASRLLAKWGAETGLSPTTLSSWAQPKPRVRGLLNWATWAPLKDFFFLSFYWSNPYTQLRAQTHYHKIKSSRLLQQSQPGTTGRFCVKAQEMRLGKASVPWDRWLTEAFVEWHGWGRRGRSLWENKERVHRYLEAGAMLTWPSSIRSVSRRRTASGGTWRCSPFWRESCAGPHEPCAQSASVVRDTEDLCESRKAASPQFMNRNHKSLSENQEGWK